MKRIGIIGASGFIGKNLVHYLGEKGSFELQPTSRHEKTGYIHLKLDFNEQLIGFVKNNDIIIYLAHEGGPTQPIHVEQAVEKNITPLKNLLKAVKAAKKERPIKIIYFSSGGTVYGISKTRTPWKESDPLHPVSSYGHAKVRAEKLLEVASEYGLCEAICVRAANPYGNRFAHEKPQGVIDVILSRLSNQQPFNLFDPPETVRDFIHIRDLNRALTHILDYKTSYDVFNIGSSKGTSLQELISKIESISGRKIEIGINSPDERVTQVPWSVLNVDKATAVLGWKPEIDLEAGLKEIIELKIGNGGSK
jgi:UDP-glucose 4-epimerase